MGKGGRLAGSGYAPWPSYDGWIGFWVSRITRAVSGIGTGIKRALTATK